MDIDTTGLYRIGRQTAREDFLEPLGGKTRDNPTSIEKPATDAHSAPEEHIRTHRLDAEKRERENMRKAYRDYQQNIKRAGSLRSEILKEIHSGGDPVAILLKAVECISLMTGDKAIYTQSKEDITAVYGHGLKEVAPLQQELQEAKSRLTMLERSELREDTEDYRRIQTAITAHRQKIRSLQEAIESASHEADKKEREAI